MIYKLPTNGNGIWKMEGDAVIASIPDDPANRDWQEYQAWLEEGNTPEPADPEPEPEPTREEKETEAASLLMKLGASDRDAARLVELLR